MFARSGDWTTLLPLLKTLSPSIFNSVGFRSSMGCIELDIEKTDENIFKELGVFFDGKVLRY